MRDTIFLGERAYSREPLLIDLEALHWLQRESIRLGSTPSELVNKFILSQKENTKNE